MIRLVLWFWLALGVGFAQPPGPSPTTAASIPGEQPALRPPPEAEVQEIARRIGLKLRCPVCQGLSVADSTSPAAVQIQQLVRDLVAQGYDEAQIYGYFTSRYDDWILLEPPAGGLDNVIWLAPLGAGLVALGLILAMIGRARNAEDPAPNPAPPETQELPKDAYKRRLLDEVDE